MFRTDFSDLFQRFRSMNTGIFMKNFCRAETRVSPRENNFLHDFYTTDFHVYSQSKIESDVIYFHCRQASEKRQKKYWKQTLRETIKIVAWIDHKVYYYFIIWQLINRQNRKQRKKLYTKENGANKKREQKIIIILIYFFHYYVLLQFCCIFHLIRIQFYFCYFHILSHKINLNIETIEIRLWEV